MRLYTDLSLSFSYCIIALAFYVYPDDADDLGDAIKRFFSPHP